MILADSSPEKATEVANRIQARMEANRFEIASRTFKMTLSLGVSIYPTDSDDLQECMRAADAALYCAKEAGGNRAIRYDRDDLQPTDACSVLPSQIPEFVSFLGSWCCKNPGHLQSV